MGARLSILWVAITCLAATSCARVPPATRQEIDARDQWAQRVSPADRQQVFAEADRHTSWGEKRKIQYEIDRFQHIERQEKLKNRKSTTRRGAAAATAPSTAPAAP